MKRLKPILAGTALALLIVAAAAALPAETRTQPASANQQAECPAGSYLMAYKDEENTQPICKLEPTGCPYGDSIPLGPDCDKHAPSKDQTPPDPNRPYYDGDGNKYDYQGNLITPAPTQAAQCGGK